MEGSWGSALEDASKAALAGLSVFRVSGFGFRVLGYDPEQ